MNGPLSVVLGGEIIGLVENLREDWPHFMGDFVPSPKFAGVEKMFTNLRAYRDEGKTHEFAVQLQDIFELGLELRLPDGTSNFRRSSRERRPGEISIIWLSNNEISFRLTPT